MVQKCLRARGGGGNQTHEQNDECGSTPVGRFKDGKARSLMSLKVEQSDHALIISLSKSPNAATWLAFLQRKRMSLKMQRRMTEVMHGWEILTSLGCNSSMAWEGAWYMATKYSLQVQMPYCVIR